MGRSQKRPLLLDDRDEADENTEDVEMHSLV